MKSSYIVRKHPLGGIFWAIRDVDLALGTNVFDLIAKFVSQVKHDDYDLMIFNTKDQTSTIVKTKDVPSEVSRYYQVKHATMTFFAEDVVQKHYVVGLEF